MLKLVTYCFAFWQGPTLFVFFLDFTSLLVNLCQVTENARNHTLYGWESLGCILERTEFDQTCAKTVVKQRECCTLDHLRSLQWRLAQAEEFADDEERASKRFLHGAVVHQKTVVDWF